MKNTGILLIAALLSGCGYGTAKLDNTTQKASYAIGYKMGERMQSSGADLDVNAFVAGVRDGVKGKPEKARMTSDQMDKALDDYRQQMVSKHQAEMKKEAAANQAKADAFLKENAKKPDVHTLPSGVQYIVEKSGDPKGPSPTLADTVVADYTGTLLDGKVFDSSIKRGQPATFPLDHVIDGWKKALVHMHVGDKWKIFIPPQLAYGEEGAGDVIGPNELLIFEVQLEKVEKPSATGKPAKKAPATKK